MNADERIALDFVSDHPYDAARLLERGEPGDAAAILSSIPPSFAARVYRALSPASAAGCGAAMDERSLAAIVEALPLDAAGPAMRRLDEARKERVLELLPEERRNQLRAMLAYPEDSAGAIADPLVFALPADITVADAQKQLRGVDEHVLYYIYIVDRDKRLVGVLALPELMAARPRQLLSAVMRSELVTLDAAANLPTIAIHPAWRDHDALPVVDTAARLVGAISHKTIRRLALESGRPMMETIVNLSELYWAGLAGIMATIAPAPARTKEDEHVP